MKVPAKSPPTPARIRLHHRPNSLDQGATHVLRVAGEGLTTEKLHLILAYLSAEHGAQSY